MNPDTTRRRVDIRTLPGPMQHDVQFAAIFAEQAYRQGVPEEMLDPSVRRQ